MKSAHAFMCDGSGGGDGVCVCMKWVVFIAIAVDVTSIFVAVHFLMKNIYQSCDRGRAVKGVCVTLVAYRHDVKCGSSASWLFQDLR